MQKKRRTNCVLLLPYGKEPLIKLKLVNARYMIRFLQSRIARLRGIQRKTEKRVSFCHAMEQKCRARTIWDAIREPDIF
jgi:hypothetical protein